MMSYFGKAFADLKYYYLYSDDFQCSYSPWDSFCQ